MDIAVSHETGAVPVTIFHLKGDLLQEEPLIAAAKEAYGAGTRYLLLDLEEVPFISSAGLRALHELHNLLQGNIGDEGERAVRHDIAAGAYRSPHLKLLKPSKNALRALKVAGYDMFLDIHQRRSQALASFSG
jgi:hypothetical protein